MEMTFRTCDTCQSAKTGWVSSEHGTGARRLVSTLSVNSSIQVGCTNGCIVLPNAELLELQHDLEPLITPVIITRQIRLATTAQITAIRNELIAALDKWRLSYRNGDWYTSLSLYAADFEYRGLNRDEWSAYRMQTVAARQISDFTIDGVMLLADPEEENLFLSRFRLTIADNTGRIVTVKRLYWRRSENGELRIVAEDNG